MGFRSILVFATQL